MTNKVLITAIAVLTLTCILCGIKACNMESEPVFHYGTAPSNDIYSLENVLRKKEKQYAHTIWQLQKRSDSLQKIADESKSLLLASQKKSNALESKVLGLSKKVKTSIDTTEKLSACDSLQVESEMLIAQQQEKDSLCTTTIESLEHVIQNKDSALILCYNYNDTLSTQLIAQVERQRQLEQSLTQSRKEAVRNKVFSKILSATTLILSGITAAMILTH